VTGAQFFRSSGAPTVLYQCLTSWPLTRSRQAGPQSSTVTPPSHPRVHPRRGPQQISMTSESTSTQRLENCVPLANVRIGTWVHSIECRAGRWFEQPEHLQTQGIWPGREDAGTKLPTSTDARGTVRLSSRRVLMGSDSTTADTRDMTPKAPAIAQHIRKYTNPTVTCTSSLQSF
jgi:hypothetical protein